jgi:hypothetical protein
MFCYSALRENELRVLTVLPPDNTQRDEPIRCLLEHVSIKAFTEEYMTWERENGHDLSTRPHKTRLAWLEHVNAREVSPPSNDESRSEEAGVPTQERNASRYTWGDYVSLSYSWGSESNETAREINLNGHSFRVTKNLQAALYFIQNTGSLTTAVGSRVKIWIDAICIQQTDQDEKIREIRRMKKIYGGSLGVVVHLGPHLDDTDLAIDSLQLIATELREYISEGDYPPVMHRIGTNDTNRSTFIALSKVLCQPYWRRLLILQELAMSDASTILGYGNRQFQFSDLILTSKFYWHNVDLILSMVGSENLDFIDMNNCNWVVMFVHELWDLSRRLEDGLPVTHRHLQLPLDLSRNGKSKLTHDKVFGLLAILPDAVGEYMKPFHDYTLPAKEIFVEFTKGLVAATGDLGVICKRSLH